jgi:hypothetical protein
LEGGFFHSAYTMGSSVDTEGSMLGSHRVNMNNHEMNRLLDRLRSCGMHATKLQYMVLH